MAAVVFFGLRSRRDDSISPNGRNSTAPAGVEVDRGYRSIPSEVGVERGAHVGVEWAGGLGVAIEAGALDAHAAYSLNVHQRSPVAVEECVNRGGSAKVDAPTERELTAPPLATHEPPVLGELLTRYHEQLSSPET